MQASPLVTFGILAIALIASALIVLGQALAARRVGESPRRVGAFWAGALVLWLALSGVLAASGVLGRFDLRPPPMALMFVTVLGLGISLGVTRAGERLARGLPLWALVGFQAFRFPLELVMHRAGSEGVMPVEMSFSGYNFDIATGIGALVLAPLLAKKVAPRWAVMAWNAYGLAALFVVAVVAFISSPMVQAFGSDPRHVNTWVTEFPFVWLPAVLVSAALAGHIIVWRRLSLEGVAARPLTA